MLTTPARQPQYIITEAVFNHVVAALRDNRQYDVAEYLIHGATHTSPPAPAQQCIVVADRACLQAIIDEVDSPNDWETSLRTIKKIAIALLQKGEQG